MSLRLNYLPLSSRGAINFARALDTQRGGSFNFRPNQYGGSLESSAPWSFPVLLTSKQEQQIQKSINSGKEVIIKITPQQAIAHLLMSKDDAPHDKNLAGGSFWRKLVRGFKKVGGAVWKVLKPIAKGTANALGVDDLVQAVSGVAAAIPGGQKIANAIDSTYQTALGDKSVDPRSTLSNVSQTISNVREAASKIKPAVQASKVATQQLAQDVQSAASQQGNFTGNSSVGSGLTTKIKGRGVFLPNQLR